MVVDMVATAVDMEAAVGVMEAAVVDMETLEAMVVDMAARVVLEDMAPLDLRVAGVAAVARTSAAATARATLEVPPGDRVDMVDSVLLRTVVDREATALAAAV